MASLLLCTIRNSDAHLGVWMGKRRFNFLLENLWHSNVTNRNLNEVLIEAKVKATEMVKQTFKLKLDAAFSKN